MTARDALDIATRGSAACLGRSGELGTLRVGAAGDVVCWPVTGVAFAGALTDLVEAWLRCGPVSARHTVVAGVPVVENGELINPRVDEMLSRHRAAALRIQRVG
jgi:cytosine/adenosine deaminase-related metal-dependent hydrolase